MASSDTATDSLGVAPILVGGVAVVRLRDQNSTWHLTPAEARRMAAVLVWAADSAEWALARVQDTPSDAALVTARVAGRA